jgi:hypothetical protein
LLCLLPTAKKEASGAVPAAFTASQATGVS